MQQMTDTTGVRAVVLDAPPLNILTRGVLAELRSQLSELAQDQGLRVLILRATGRDFSAGASVPEHLAPEYEAMIPEFMQTIRALYFFPVPVIAAVRGRCLGGGFELALCADIIIASETLHMGTPEIQLGVFPPVACALLPDIVHPSLAAELLYTGEVISAHVAEAEGLVHRVVADVALEPDAELFAARIAKHSAAALRHAKRATRGPRAVAVEEQLRHAQRVYLEDLMRTRDAHEGLQSFVEKRAHAWSHR